MKNFLKRKANVFISLLCFVVLNGCANHMITLYVNDKPEETGPSLEVVSPTLESANGATKAIDNHFFVGGVFQNDRVDAGKVCKSKGGAIARITTEQRWYQSALTFMTLGLYSPMQTTVFCK